MTISKSKTLLAGIAALAIAGIAQANPITVTGAGHETQSIKVRIGGLNLTSEAGRASLTNRINFASLRVCGIGAGSALDNTHEAKSCLTNARADAWAQVDARLASGSRADLVVGVQ